MAVTLQVSVIPNQRSTPEGAKVNVCERSLFSQYFEIPRRYALSDVLLRACPKNDKFTT